MLNLYFYILYKSLTQKINYKKDNNKDNNKNTYNKDNNIKSIKIE
jgi:hypothetical protein